MPEPAATEVRVQETIPISWDRHATPVDRGSYVVVSHDGDGARLHAVGARDDARRVFERLTAPGLHVEMIRVPAHYTSLSGCFLCDDGTRDDACAVVMSSRDSRNIPTSRRL